MRRHARGATKLRVMFGTEIAIGPGKAELLAAIAETGSISASAKRLGMSYRRAWLLVDTMNRCSAARIAPGREARRRRAGVTPFGRACWVFRAMQSRVERSIDRDLTAFSELLADRPK